MKYNESEFNSAVEDYKKRINNAKNKNFFVIFDISDKDAFYSIAPLSRALHDLGNDASCTGINKNSEALEALKDVWKTFEDLEGLSIRNEIRELMCKLKSPESQTSETVGELLFAFETTVGEQVDEDDLRKIMKLHREIMSSVDDKTAMINTINKYNTIMTRREKEFMGILI